MAGFSSQEGLFRKGLTKHLEDDLGRFAGRSSWRGGALEILAQSHRRHWASRRLRPQAPFDRSRSLVLQGMLINVNRLQSSPVLFRRQRLMFTKQRQHVRIEGVDEGMLGRTRVVSHRLRRVNDDLV